VYPDWRASWGLVVVGADLGPGETLRFVGDSPARSTADLDASAGGKAIQLEALTEWLAKKDVRHG